MSAETKNPTVESPLKIEALPPRFRGAVHTILKEAEKKDVGYCHYWVRKTASGSNEKLKRWSGLEPLEDKERLKKIGLGHMINAGTGRATWMDTELWVMPLSMKKNIQALRNQQLDAQRQEKRAETAAEFADIQGRTAAQVRPFIKEDRRETITE